jgi:hypothetical protein
MLFFIIFVKIEMSLKFYFYYIKMHQKVETLLGSLYLMFCLLVANLKSELDFHN